MTPDLLLLILGFLGFFYLSFRVSQHAKKESDEYLNRLDDKSIKMYNKLINDEVA